MGAKAYWGKEGDTSCSEEGCACFKGVGLGGGTVYWVELSETLAKGSRGVLEVMRRSSEGDGSDAFTGGKIEGFVK